MDKFNKLYEEVVDNYKIEQLDEAMVRLKKNQKIIDLLIINHIYSTIKSINNTNTLYNKGSNVNSPDPNKKLKDNVIKSVNNISDYMQIVDTFNSDFQPQFALTEKELLKRLNKFTTLDSSYIYKLVNGIKHYKSKEQNFSEILATL